MPSILPTFVSLVSTAVVVSAFAPIPSPAPAQGHSEVITSPSSAEGLPEVITVGIVGDYGWTGWQPAPLAFCDNVLPQLQAANITIPNEVINDCGSDRSSVFNATAFQESTASYIGQVCEMKGCDAFLSVGDNFYDSGVDFTTGGIIRFQEAWVDMYTGPAFNNTRWYQCLGNHDVVKGQSGVDFETQIAPLYDSRWYFGTEGLPYYTYNLEGKDWNATFVVVDSDCFLPKYQKTSSVYNNPYTIACYQDQQTQVDFLAQAFAASNADWKFLQLHHPYMSATSNNTGLAPLISIVEQHNGIVVNGHDHCLAHFNYNNTDYILAGAGGFPSAGDCNNGVPLGPYTKWLGANAQAAANGFVTMDISKDEVVVEYYARDMRFEGSDLYPVWNDLAPSYTFTITQHAS